jgi:O-acetyl-ADP-ribose deacetylase
MKAEFKVNKTVLQLIVGDITEAQTDAIINAANSTLLGGGGVDGAIHSKGGHKILEECKKIRATIWPDGLPTGQAVITSGGDLKAKFVIHTVGPIWHGGGNDEARLFRLCYVNSLKLAVSEGLSSVAFPSISTGAYGYPVEKASLIAIEAIRNFLEKDDSLEIVVLVLFSERVFRVYLDAAKAIFK